MQLTRKSLLLAALVAAGALGVAPTPANAAGQTLIVSPASDLDPNGQQVNVSGGGFDGTQGVYVRYCAQPAGAVGTAAGRATRCRPEQTAPNTWWVHPGVPGTADEAVMNPNGTFNVNLFVPSTFSTGSEFIDCRTSVCGVFTRRDHNGGAADYSKDNFVPVSFGDGSDPPPPPPPLPPADPCPGGLLRPILKALFSLLGQPAPAGLCSIP